MTKLHPYGVAIPGGSESLFHGRSTIEDVAKTGIMGEFAIVDVDLVDCVGLFEWPAIREAYASLLPELLPWEKWRQAEQSLVRLPCGEDIMVNRGAGQGEPDEPLKTAVVLGSDVSHAHDDTRTKGIGKWADAWFIDDGQLFCILFQVESILQALDARLLISGATRGSLSNGNDIKSTVRTFGMAEECVYSPYVQDTCNIITLNESCKILGGELGGMDHTSRRWRTT
eukprot:1272573-Heterocapsa_arctica.AAC.1